MLRKISTALISVSDKTNIKELAEFLSSQNIKIISTGGTYKIIKEFGINVTEISEHTSFPEIMDGRVKTLHPKVHGGLLANLDIESHKEALNKYEIEKIDLIIVNLYPFIETINKGANFEDSIENIDIGGPSMIRSAAKNYLYTTVITDIKDYEKFIQEMKDNANNTTIEFRKYLAYKAFNLTAKYDSAISNWFGKQVSNILYPEQISLVLNKISDLRYGENPHQKAAFYSETENINILNAKQLQGKDLSYNNINDLDAALSIIQEFKEPTAIIIKHTNPCGSAIGKDIYDAYIKAFNADPLSAFGGIVALNQIIDEKLASKLSEIFYEVIIAPKFTDKAKNILSKKKNLRLVESNNLNLNAKNHFQYKSVQNGFLVQEYDNLEVNFKNFEIVTKQKPTNEQVQDMVFGFKLCKHVKSNAIILARNQTAIGVGAGQMSRIESVRIAISKAKANENTQNLIHNSILASDAFFPFSDSILMASNAGIKAIIQPGGSVKDSEVIKAADEHGIAMVFTHQRHFFH